MTIVAMFLIGSILAFFYALGQQHLYSSSEVLQVQKPTIAADLAPSTITGSSARRLQIIEQQVMSRDSVLDIIAKLGLFADQPQMTRSEKVAAIRKSVSIQGVAAAREGYSDDGAVSLLRITADWPSAEGAQKIAHEFSQHTIALSVSTRLQQANETLEFFKLREKSLEEDVAALEAEITRFRAENDVALPGNTESIQREIEQASASILTIDRRMLALQRRLDAPATSRIERRQREEDLLLMQDLEAERALLASTRERLSEDLAGTPQLDLRMAQYDRRLADLRTQLREVAAHRQEAQVGYQLESRRQSERLTVLEPAPLPDYPFTRSRKVIFLLGAAASLLFGLGLAFVLDLRHPVIRSAEQLEREIGLRPVVSIPEARSPRRPGVFARLFRRAASGGRGR
ncbi:DUF874 domain-containing protein [Roseovarius spongiae]|nr:DUF874 domain-containing protein [Roseovarius spongiae]